MDFWTDRNPELRQHFSMFVYVVIVNAINLIDGATAWQAATAWWPCRHLACGSFDRRPCFSFGGSRAECPCRLFVVQPASSQNLHGRQRILAVGIDGLRDGHPRDSVAER